jgi:hypothetical protein
MLYQTKIPKSIGITTSLILFFMISWGQNTLKQDFPKLSLAYEVNKNPVDYIIVVDQSGTVKRYWEPIKSSAAKLVALANEGDYLTLIGFSESVDNLILARKINSSSKNAIVNEINGLPDPKGSYTDLFESVDFTLEKGINRPEGNNLQIIFYFTDFKNEPPPASKWRNTSTTTLSAKRINYVDKTGKLVNIFAFQLPLEAGAGRDYEEFSRIFDNRVKRIISDLNTMQEWFGRLSQEISREKLRLLLQNDLQKFLVVEEINIKADKIDIKIANRLDIPVLIKEVELSNNDKTFNIDQTFNGIEIPANGKAKLSLSLASFLQQHPSLLEKRINFREPILKIHSDFRNLESEFGKLNIPALQTQSILYPETLVIRTGIPYWLVGGALLLLLLIVYLIYKTWIKPEWTFNRRGFKVTVTLDGKLLPNSNKVFEKSKRPVIIEHTIISASDVSPEIARMISESQFKIFVVPTKPRFFTMKPKRGTYLFAEAKGIGFKVKKLVRGNVIMASLPTNRRLYTEKAFLHKGVTIIGELTSGIARNQLELNFYNK